MTSTMATEQIDHATPARRGRSARHAERLAKAMESVPYLTRKLPPVEVLSTDGLEAIEYNADTLLQEVGIEIVNFPEAVEIFRGAGADVQGTRVRFERGHVPPARPGDRPALLHAGRAQPRRAASSSATRTWSSSRPTARRSSTTSTRAAATRRSRTSATS